MHTGSSTESRVTWVWPRRFLLERFQHNQSILFLAVRQNGSAVGFTQFFPSFSSVSDGRILILNDLFVEPDAHRMRVGSLLLSAAANFGRAVVPFV